ncbi:hypothetical protein H310_05844 [Aphanomyces invadans]|uniref:Carrier domain-containing protein n=1 Tax=Aphanomyces invadans TaxID=157072 RepID=A0A024U7A0_9STRA|nr:hypothetical protein H310_05844 [Aphanomyces invadans]ETW02296.1 hypothetical protein H310_05844 [Aphanomyces invadans]|eukprot:XP_008868901.1 hypothetical protein H310_05844 [Aphanomyces invadans]
MTEGSADPDVATASAFTKEPLRSKVAIEGPDVHVTFGQLGMDIAAMRDILLLEGITCVAIDLPFGVAQVVAMCGAIAAQAVYVPIDETQSVERNTWILQNGCVQAMLCHTDSPTIALIGLVDKVVAALPLHETVLVKGATQPSTTNELLQDPDGMYILFTSGSTGVPKGVVGSRRATKNRLQWMWEAYPFQPDEKVLRSTKLTFVDAIWEILGTLWRGQTLVLLPHATSTPPLIADVAHTMAIIEAFQVTRLTVVPSVLQVLLSVLKTLPSSITTVLVSGETLTGELLGRAMQAAPTTRFINLYGSTEVSGDVTFATFSLATTTSEERELWQCYGVPIGKPIHQAKIKLVPQEGGDNASNQGELWVAGAPLALGYLNPADTRAKFVWDSSGNVWLRTGDVCCWRGNALFYCGRVDSQVKIGGIAIHLEAVEVWRSLAHVQQNVTAASRRAFTHSWQNVLPICLFTASHTRRALEQLFRTHVAVATRVIPIEFADFPYTSSGKICRRQLRDRLNEVNSSAASVPPQDVVDSILMARVESVLSKHVDLDALTLAELGGNSLVATMVQHDLRMQCGVELQLADIVQKTVGELRAMVPRKCRHNERQRPLSEQPSDVGDTTHKRLKRVKVVATRWDVYVAWSVEVKKCIDATPLVIATPRPMVVVGSHDHHVTCVDISPPHDILWQTELPDRIESSCVALDDRIYVGCYDGHLYCLRSMDGKVLWSFATADQVKCTPLVVASKRVVVCGSHDHHVYGLDVHSGVCVFKLPFQNGIYSTPAFANDMLFCASIGGDLRAYEWSSLQAAPGHDPPPPIWTRQFQAPVFAKLVATEGDVLVVACADSCVYGISSLTGATAWTARTTKPIFSTPCVVPQSSPPRIVFGSHDGILRCVDLTNGKVLASVNLDDAIFASPTMLSRGEHCGVCTTTGMFYVWDTTSPTWQSRVALGGHAFSSPVLHCDAVYVGTRANHLVCLRNRLDGK